MRLIHSLLARSEEKYVPTVYSEMYWQKFYGSFRLSLDSLVSLNIREHLCVSAIYSWCLSDVWNDWNPLNVIDFVA